jgi:hypothetical protein
MRRSLIFAPAIMAASLFAIAAGPAWAACFTGERVLVTPFNRLGTVTSPPGDGSCRVHYDDPSHSDEWVPPYQIQSAAAPARDRATAAAGVREGRYDITVGRGFYNGYLMIHGGGYELFLPGGRSVGSGRYAFDAAGPRVRWLSGPLTNPLYDGTQMVEASGSLLKIRIGARAVATNSSR